jgi:hypothetical protein
VPALARRAPEPESPASAVEALDRLAIARARLLDDGGALDPELARLVAAALDAVLAKGDRPAAVALRRAGLHQRNALIRQAVAFYTGSPRARAMALLRDARRYVATAWLRDRGCVGCPDRIQGTVQEILWHAFKAHPSFPSSLRQLQNILPAGDLRNT